MAEVNPGYMGFLTIGSTNIRITDCSLVAKQEVNAPDLMGGSYNHHAWNYGKVEISGSASGPIDENFTTDIWDWATKRDSCGIMSTSNPVTVNYYCVGGSSPVGIKSQVKFSNILVNQLTISCTAGDVATFSLDMIGSGTVTYGDADTWASPPDAKLLTWDKVNATVTAPGASIGTFSAPNLSSFDISIANNITAQYSLGQADLFPFALVTGMRSITGSLSAYNIPDFEGVDKWDDYTAGDFGGITFNIGSNSYSVSVEFHRISPAGQVGPIVSTLGYTGVGNQPFDV